MQFPTLHPAFFTATCKDWLYLLQDVQCKDIIINSLSFLVENERVHVFGFVIMNNHLHIIWQMLGNHKPEALLVGYFALVDRLTNKKLCHFKFLVANLGSSVSRFIIACPFCLDTKRTKNPDSNRDKANTIPPGSR